MILMELRSVSLSRTNKVCSLQLKFPLVSFHVSLSHIFREQSTSSQEGNCLPRSTLKMILILLPYRCVLRTCLSTDRFARAFIELSHVCIIAGEGHKAAKERVKQEKLAKVAKVIGISKLKSKYESHEAKRNLCAQYDMFIADDRVIPLLPKLIGEKCCSLQSCLSQGKDAFLTISLRP